MKPPLFLVVLFIVLIACNVFSSSGVSDSDPQQISSYELNFDPTTINSSVGEITLYEIVPTVDDWDGNTPASGNYFLGLWFTSQNRIPEDKPPDVSDVFIISDDGRTFKPYVTGTDGEGHFGLGFEIPISVRYLELHWGENPPVELEVYVY